MARTFLKLFARNYAEILLDIDERRPPTARRRSAPSSGRGQTIETPDPPVEDQLIVDLTPFGAETPKPKLAF